MKYESNTKTARNQAVREYHIAHPEASLKEVGEMFGISHARVSQLIKPKVTVKKEAK